MQLILDLNASSDCVTQLEVDDRNTGIPSGSYIVDSVIYDKIIKFLNEKANNATQNRKAG